MITFSSVSYQNQLKTSKLPDLWLESRGAGFRVVFYSTVDCEMLGIQRLAHSEAFSVTKEFSVQSYNRNLSREKKGGCVTRNVH